MRLVCLAILLMLTPSSSPAREPLIVAHRGASEDGPENTLAAFRLAWEQGADAIEGDFQLTRDNEIVCVHDKDTGRLASTNLVIRESTLAELRGLDVGAHAGDAFVGERIPTLAEVLAIVPPKKKIYVEVKSGPDIIPRLCQTISRSGMQPDQVVVISFNASVIRAFKDRANGSQAYWLCAFTKNESGKVRPSLKTVLKTLEETGADGLDSTSNIPPTLAAALAQAGYEWHTWTVNDGPTALQARKLGARSITTDLPARLRQELGR